MRLSDYTVVYGSIETATHILIQKLDNNNQSEYYSRNVQNKFTTSLHEATYFTFADFVNKGFHEIINHTKPLEKTDIIFCNPNTKTSLTQYELSKIIKSNEPSIQTFVEIITVIKDSVIPQKDVIAKLLNEKSLHHKWIKHLLWIHTYANFKKKKN
jgi:hypothetical protein